VAQHESALKRHRQSEKRRVRNKDLRTRLKHSLREARGAVASKDAGATTVVAAATRALDKAVAKGVIHRNTAARKISRLAKAVHAAGR
jgi:small subunit ribosomal protein S20